MKRTYEEAVDITVKWWSQKAFDTALRWSQKAFDTALNNGDDSETGWMAFLLMNLVSSKAQEKVTPETKTKFEQKLTEILLSKEGQGRLDNQLDVDYHPNQLLSEACEFAGVDEYALPCKTFTYIDENNVVRGRYQYGGAWFEL